METGRPLLPFKCHMVPSLKHLWNANMRSSRSTRSNRTGLRNRYTTAGAKDDRCDAFGAASSLRTDPHCFRGVVADDPLVVRLRGLSRTEESFSAQSVRGVNQLGV